MRKLLLTAVALLGIAACQKDFYLEDLQSAENRIEQLQGTINTLASEITDAQESLTHANEMIIELNSDKQLLSFNIEELQDLLNTKNEEITNLIASNTASSEEIATLSNEITSLNDAIHVAEDTITDLAADLEYAEDNPEIVYVTVTEVVEVIVEKVVTQYIVTTVTNPVNTELQDQVIELQAMIDAADDVDAQIIELQNQLEDADADKIAAVEKAATDLADLQSQLDAALAHDVVDDALIAELQASIFGLQGDVSSLQTQVLSLEGQVSALQISLATANTNLETTQGLLDAANFGNETKTAYINELKATQLDLNEQLTVAMNQFIIDEATIATLNAKIVELNQDITDFTAAVEGLQAMIFSLTSQLTTANTSLESTKATLETVEGDKAALQITYDALVTEKEDLETQLAAALEDTDTDVVVIMELNTKVETLETNITNLEAEVKTLTDTNEELVIENEDLTAQLATATTDLATANSNLATANENLVAVKAQLETADANFKAYFDLSVMLATQIETLNGEIAAKNLKLTELKNDAEADATEIAELEADIAILNGDITTLDAEIVDLGITITNLTNQVEGLTTDLATANASLSSTQALLDTANVANDTLQTQLDGYKSYALELEAERDALKAQDIIDAAAVAELDAKIVELNANIVALNTQVSDLVEANEALDAVVCVPVVADPVYTEWSPAFEGQVIDYDQTRTKTVVTTYDALCDEEGSTVVTTETRAVVVVKNITDTIESTEAEEGFSVNTDGDLYDVIFRNEGNYSYTVDGDTTNIAFTGSEAAWYVVTDIDCTPIVNTVWEDWPEVLINSQDSDFTQTRTGTQTTSYSNAACGDGFTETVTESREIVFTLVNGGDSAYPETKIPDGLGGWKHQDVNGDGDLKDFTLIDYIKYNVTHYGTHYVYTNLDSLIITELGNN